MAGVLQRLADERDVVGGATATAGLANKHRRATQVVLAREHGLHDLARHQDGRVADVVVNVLQARVDGLVVHGRQQHQVVAGGAQQLFHDLEVDRAHLRREDGVALGLHLLGVAHLLERGTLGLAVHGRATAQVRLARLLKRAVRHVDAHGRLLRGRAGSGLALQLGALLLQRRHERAHADARGAQVGHLVDLEHGVDLARGLQDLLHLVGREGVQAAAKALQLDHVQVVAGRHKARGAVQAAVVHPLVHHADRALRRHLVRHGVLRQHRKAKAVQHLGDGVVDLAVVVVRTAGEHDAVGVVVLDPLQGLVALAVHRVLEREVLLPGGVNGGVHLGARQVRTREAALARRGVLLALHLQDLVQPALQLVLVVVRDERVQVLHVRRGKLVHVQPQRLRIAHHDRAVVVVRRGVVLLALPANARHPDEVRILLQEVHDVPVRELRGVAHGLGRHGLRAGLVRLARRLVAQHHAEAQLREERVPERVVLVHVQRARDAHGAARGLVGRQALAVKQQAVLELKEVRCLGLLAPGLAGALLAAVARDEAAAVAKAVDRQQAVVRAPAAVGVGVLHLQVVDLFAREQAGGPRRAGAVAGEKGSSVRAHRSGDVGPDHLAAREQLERAQRRVAHERAALHHHVLADLVVVAQLDDLEERVLDDGVGKAGGHVAYGRALLLGLLHARVHEHGAAAAQVNGMLALHGSGGKLLDGHAHGVREVRDEAAAARGARLVQADVLDDAAANLQALHVLAANVQDEVHVGHEGLCAAQVRHRLDLAGVRAQRLDQDALAVARRRHMANHAVVVQVVVDVVHDLAGRAQHVAVVVVVPRVQQLAVLAHHGGLHRGGAGVQTNEHAAVVVGQAALLHHLLVVALLELAVVVLGRKQGVQARNLGALRVAQVLQVAYDLLERNVLVALAGQRRARRHEEVGVTRHDAVLLVQLQRLIEALAQLGEVLQRSAEKRHIPTYGVSARQAGYGLVRDGLEDGGRDVLARGALVQERLHVRLREHAATARDGVYVRRALRKLVQAGGVRLHEGCHLVDKRAGSACARAVHALLDAVVEVDDLRVLAAELDGAVRLRNKRLDGVLRRDDLLHKLHSQPLRQQHAAGSGDGHAHGHVAQGALRLLEHLLRRRLHVGVVALVVRVDQVVVVVDHGKLHRGRAHVDAQAQVRVRKVDEVFRAQLGVYLLQLHGLP